jgi:hypothetical protein
MVSREECWDLMEDLNGQAYDTVYELWTEAGEDEELREQAGEAQQSVFLDLIEEEVSDEQWEAFQHYYKTDEDFKIQYEGYAGRPMWNVQ